MKKSRPRSNKKNSDENDYCDMKPSIRRSPPQYQNVFFPYDGYCTGTSQEGGGSLESWGSAPSSCSSGEQGQHRIRREGRVEGIIRLIQQYSSLLRDIATVCTEKEGIRETVGEIGCRAVEIGLGQKAIVCSKNFLNISCISLTFS